MKIIDQGVLDQLSKAAAESPRRRKNLNMHDDYTDPCQRLFNAVEPATYIRPHRHLNPPKAECFMAVRGKMALVVFDDKGGINQVVPFGDGCDVQALELPAGQWHTFVVLKPGSIFFEAKTGPYVPLSDTDLAPWSPVEGSPDADRYVAALTTVVADYL